MRLHALGAFVACALLFASKPAEACWCGYAAGVGRVDVTQPMPNFDYCPVAWDPKVVRHWATWVVRLDAALPPGHTLEAFAGYAEVRSARGVAELEWKDLPDLFEEVSKLGSDPERAKRARKKNAQVFTVQIFASATDAGAERIAKAADEANFEDRGFFFAGGMPATNPVAHVVEESVDGRLLRKVLVGAFLDRRDASVAARDLGRKLRLATFVRRL